LGRDASTEAAGVREEESGEKKAMKKMDENGKKKKR